MSFVMETEKKPHSKEACETDDRFLHEIQEFVDKKRCKK
jgi:hypothetical protein